MPCDIKKTIDEGCKLSWHRDMINSDLRKNTDLKKDANPFINCAIDISKPNPYHLILLQLPPSPFLDNPNHPHFNHTPTILISLKCQAPHFNTIPTIPISLYSK